MWKYEKMLQYPVKIRKRNLKMANLINAQVGGPQGELGAALRYLNQSFTMPDEVGKALLTDIGTEELAHVEMISTMIYQLMKDASLKELKEAAKSINSIANNADTKFQNAKTGLASILGLGACFGGKLKSFSEGIMKGISFGANLFKK